MHKRWSIFALIGAASMLLAGCGSAAPAASSTTQNDLLAKVMQTHELVIAESAFAPQDFQDPSTHQWTGYDVSILKGFAKSIGVKLKIDALPFASAIQAVADKRADITIDIYWNSDRAKELSFSRPMLNYDDVVEVNSRNPTIASDTLSALKGKTIAVVVGSAEVAEADAVPNANVKNYNTVAEAFGAVSNGNVDATFQPSTDGPWAVEQNPQLHIKILGAVPSTIAPPIASLRGYFAVPKGSYSKRFLAKLDAYLKQIECSGQEQQILDKYNLKSTVFLQGICTAPNVYAGGS